MRVGTTITATVAAAGLLLLSSTAVPLAGAFLAPNTVGAPSSYLQHQRQQRSFVVGLPTTKAAVLRSATTVATDVPAGSGGTTTNEAALSEVDEISAANPLKVVIAGAGVGGLTLALSLSKHPHLDVTVLEQTSEFKRFGGPIQLASNALQTLKVMDEDIYNQVMDKFTTTGDKVNGIKDGIRTEWYAKFDLKTPAEDRKMPYTGVIDRPDLQEIYLRALPKGTIQNGDGVETYEQLPSGGVKVVTQSGREVYADALIGADGIWSSVRATMRNAPKKGDGSGAAYSGYTVYAVRESK